MRPYPTTETPEAARARIDATFARQQAAEDLKAARRLASTPQGRLTLAGLIDEGTLADREAARSTVCAGVILGVFR